MRSEIEIDPREARVFTTRFRGDDTDSDTRPPPALAPGEASFFEAELLRLTDLEERLNSSLRWSCWWLSGPSSPPSPPPPNVNSTTEDADDGGGDDDARGGEGGRKRGEVRRRSGVMEAVAVEAVFAVGEFPPFLRVSHSSFVSVTSLVCVYVIAFGKLDLLFANFGDGAAADGDAVNDPALFGRTEGCEDTAVELALARGEFAEDARLCVAVVGGAVVVVVMAALLWGDDDPPLPLPPAPPMLLAPTDAAYDDDDDAVGRLLFSDGAPTERPR